MAKSNRALRMQLICTFFTSVLFILACNKEYKITTASQAYNLRQFPKAIEMLKEEMQDGKMEASYAAYLIGDAYEKMGEYTSAERWYEKACNESKEAKACEAYGNLLLKLGEANSSYAVFQKLTQLYGQDPWWALQLEKSKFALDQNSSKSNQLHYRAQQMTTVSNSTNMENAPFYASDKVLFYTSDRPTQNPNYSWTDRGFFNIQTLDDLGYWQSVLQEVNTNFNESDIAISDSLNHIVFTRCGITSDTFIEYQFCKLYEMELIDGAWTEARVLPFCKADDVNYMHACFYNRDHSIIFASNQANGFGGYDLYIATKQGDAWLEPQLLPEVINTAFNELYPSADGDTLYFSSNGKVGLGGLDIYQTVLINGRTWTNPTWLEADINSAADDMSLQIIRQPGGDQYIFASDRKGGSGLDDIWQAKKLVVEPELVVKEPDESKIQINILVFARQVDQLDATYDPQNYALENAQIRVFTQSGEDTTAMSDAKGQLLYTLPKDVNGINVTASHPDYLTGSKAMTINPPDEAHSRAVYFLKIGLDPIPFGQEIEIEDIYYDFDKANLRADAYPALDKFLNILRQNPGLKVQLNAHTDCQGTEAYNLDLSQRRAESVVQYLLSNGISPARLTAKGFGESKRVDTCPCQSCTEEQHQANRRTTFTILN